MTDFQVSASQISTFDACARKWGWEKIAKIRTVPHPSAQLGTRVHKLLEDYILGVTTTFDFADGDGAGEIAQSGVEHLPDLTGTLWVERKFEFDLDGSLYLGYIDLETPGLIVDHKTTGKIGPYTKTPEDLLTDVQAQIYSQVYFLRNPTHDVCHLRWIYYQTKGTHKSLPVNASITRAHNAIQMEAIKGRVRTMRTYMRTVTDPMVLPATESACEAYGGCPHRSRCFSATSFKDTLKRTFKGASMGIRDEVADGGIDLSLDDVLAGRETTPTPAAEPDLTPTVNPKPTKEVKA